MKRIFIKKCLMACAIVLGALFFKPAEASAQFGGPQPNVLTDPASWVVSDVAVNLLDQQITQLQSQMGSNPTDALKFKKAFFEDIVVTLGTGQPVYSAINESYAKFTPTPGVDEVPIPNNLAPAVWAGYYQDAVNLLKK